MGFQVSKRIILCADDFGQNEAISEGILSLLQHQRLSATSCMTNMPIWPAMAKKLSALKGQAQVGLHFNLTEGQALSKKGQRLFTSINQLILRAFLRKLSQSDVEEELCAQLEAFIQAFGCTPDFIDGHQHIHHLPVIREALLKVYKKYYPDNKAWIRVSSNSLLSTLKVMPRCLKLLIITLTGALVLKKVLVNNKIPHNTSFSGSYDFSSSADYSKLFTQFLKEVDEGGVLMCHPGLKSDVDDPIYATRIKEWHYFNSEVFRTTLAQQRFEVV